eukprot:6129953-Amphidinium_carterae.2
MQTMTSKISCMTTTGAVFSVVSLVGGYGAEGFGLLQHGHFNLHVELGKHSAHFFMEAINIPILKMSSFD